MTASPTMASAPDRFRVPPTVSSEAAAGLAAVYAASQQTPAPLKPLSQADFDNANEQMEAAFAPANAALAAALKVTIRREILEGVSIVRIVPRGHKAGPREAGSRALVYLHGGAYVYFSAQTMVGLPSLIAEAMSVEIISIDYTLAPKARWRTVTDQVLTVWKALLADGYGAGSLGLLGDSAGGGLAAGSVLKMRDQHLPLPSALWLVSPWSDISGAGDSYETLADADPMLTAEMLSWCAEAYADPLEQTHPYVSPVYGDYVQPFPPTLIQGGTREIFLSNFIRQYQAIRGGGHEAVLDLYEGVPHVFQSVLPDAPESKAAVARAAAFFDEHLQK